MNSLENAKLEHFESVIVISEPILMDPRRNSKILQDKNGYNGYKDDQTFGISRLLF